MKQVYSLIPQNPSTAEIPKSIGKIWLVAGAFEAKGRAEVGQRRLVHLVAVSQRKKERGVLVN